ncbi:MAG: hypothetical protein QXI40_07475 [Ignisphaera sp.]
MVMSVSGVLQSVGAFAWGFIAMRLGVLETLPLLYAVEAASMFLAISFTKHSIEAVVSMIWLRFLAFGGEPVAHMLLIPKLFGQNNMGKLLGIQTSVVMAASIAGPLIGGLARDLTGSFITTALLSAIFSIIAAVIAIAINILIKKRSK